MHILYITVMMHLMDMQIKLFLTIMIIDIDIQTLIYTCTFLIPHEHFHN